MALPVVPVVPIVVAAHGLPRPTWRCRRCAGRTPHECTGRFRVNANGKLLDVWLLYRCGRCEATRKVDVAERVPVGSIDVDALDPGAIARDVARLRRSGADVAGDRFTVAGAVPWDGSPCRLALTFRPPLLVRLDDVVATCLGTSRSALRRLAEDGRAVPDGGWAGARSLRLWSAATVTLGSAAGGHRGENVKRVSGRPGRGVGQGHAHMGGG